MDIRQQVGSKGEELACKHLQQLGYRVVETRARTRYGEIDIIARSDTTLVFCEVKSKRQGSSAELWQNFHDAKQLQIRRLAQAWLQESTRRSRVYEIRFDAIAVVLDRQLNLVRLDHLEAAF